MLRYDEYDMIAKALNASDPLDVLRKLRKKRKVSTRDIGNFIADNADGVWFHPWLPEGFAYIDVGSGRALAASWDEQGFWDVFETTVAEAESEIALLQEEYDDSEEEA